MAAEPILQAAVDSAVEGDGKRSQVDIDNKGILLKVQEGTLEHKDGSILRGCDKGGSAVVALTKDPSS